MRRLSHRSLCVFLRWNLPISHLHGLAQERRHVEARGHIACGCKKWGGPMDELAQDTRRVEGGGEEGGGVGWGALEEEKRRLKRFV